MLLAARCRETNVSRKETTYMSFNLCYLSSYFLNKYPTHEYSTALPSIMFLLLLKDRYACILFLYKWRLVKLQLKEQSKPLSLLRRFWIAKNM